MGFMHGLRARVRFASELADHGRYAEALAIYEAAGTLYLEAGLPLKAVAVASQAVQLANLHSIPVGAVRSAVRLLAAAYRKLGLDDDAAAVESLQDLGDGS